MSVTDIRPIKTELRQKYRSLRQSMPPEIKKQRDEAIANQVRRLWQYNSNSILLIYVSTAIEVDTFCIIRRALEDGKRVAVPRCVPDSRQMDFYYIQSFEELAPGMFGVLEPEANPDRLYDERDGGLCIVPAFSYDWQGYRLGYGKGYYDRFLSRFEGNIVGICHSDCVQRTLPHGRYDRPVELLVTEKFLRRTVRNG
ncbi:MAG: 5-formyltetrahydrofolate cyclo-ligase [Clostridia bacterium]|nr:5-formyltetrahydrofolate cyclo-ligase [Clostridia bacterium]